MKTKTLILGIFLALVTVTGCSSSNDFEKGKIQLEQMGYTNVQNTGHAWFCCDEKDKFSTGFKCTDKTGKTVKGCFCSGFLKGVTVRFE